ncbi:MULTISPECIES: siderophore-interacting protein [Chryseobacterium]|uniref:NADPH-dependent ferric siderophore reductase n=1 Tax=Chryseobacterium camelliae TaxID=1265445 RepID=A0ABU0TIL7_9FLAO|nr:MULTISPECIES: siderophore-interacting protein [Chryseobacterium]MDT3409238.1 NADPH-dependent ferric siderophore reductase [Pseudacidovorax intermedius]MDQ1096900.1 NADPH-dependent ferric siderophore reductase [Chryseobacterium camelliae]MDQ1100842.1 NADPH-dependent ferric siderophore reductase [Chryseobacterium sp. SORGH_AS_1048]MDR6084284.1 NADPH-dependent ferric siderophore reductase [Chryseobacterium sp. SORGH_AS_0909]MDR6132555.1 NADPH-dependent ferric siderophore reductase [Chryseobact
MSTLNFKTIQAELRVSRKEFLTPHYVRIYLTGADIPLFANTTVGINNKILIPPKGTDRIYFPEFDYETMQWKPQPEETRPVVRTYTHRGIDTDTNEMWIDFVAHGDEGPASAWAIKAKTGDMLGVMMKDGKTELYTPAKNYLLLGDATAIPVLSAILEDLPETAQGICIIEVHGKEDEQKIETKADMQFIWLHNEHPEQGSRLAETAKGIMLPEKDRFAYVAAEFSTVKEIRNFLRKESNWQQKEVYAYSYWKSGVAEDKSAAERHIENEES